jgi:hypothetical protein
MARGRGAARWAWAAGRALLAAPGPWGRLVGARSWRGPARGKVELGRGERKGDGPWELGQLGVLGFIFSFFYFFLFSLFESYFRL